MRLTGNHAMCHAEAGKKETKLHTQGFNVFVCSIEHYFAFFAGDCPMGVALVHDVAPSEIHKSM